DFATSGSVHSAGAMGWTDNDHVMVGGTLVDVERRIPIWRHPVGTAPAFRGGVLWSVSRHDPTTLHGVDATPQAALDAASKLNADELLVIKPGMEVSVELPTGTPEADQTRARVVKQLERDGMKVVPQANVRLVGSIQAGKTVQMNYRSFGSHQV